MKKENKINIKIIVVGKIKEDYYRNKIAKLSGILQKKYDTRIIELADESIPKNAGASMMDSIMEKEGKRILGNIDNTDYVVALCIDGRPLASDKLAWLLEQAGTRDMNSVTFVIGGSLGLHQDVVKRANFKLSFSRMTFPHQLMRVMLLEQLADYL